MSEAGQASTFLRFIRVIKRPLTHFFVAVLAGGVLLFLLDAFFWLQSGSWPHFSVKYVAAIWGFVPYHLGWGGVDWMIDKWFEAPVSYLIIFISGFLAFFFPLWADDLEPPAWLYESIEDL